MKDSLLIQKTALRLERNIYASYLEEDINLSICFLKSTFPPLPLAGLLSYICSIWGVLTLPVNQSPEEIFQKQSLVSGHFYSIIQSRVLVYIIVQYLAFPPCKAYSPSAQYSTSNISNNCYMTILISNGKNWNYSFTEKPRQYLISILERLRIAKIAGVALPFFMDNSNIAAMFEMLDSSNRGTISLTQYKEGQYLLQIELTVHGHSITFSS